jgi:hypothetical protein
MESRKMKKIKARNVESDHSIKFGSAFGLPPSPTEQKRSGEKSKRHSVGENMSAVSI